MENKTRMVVNTFDIILNKQIASIWGLRKGSSEITIVFADNSAFVMSHLQDCCEDVWLEDIVGEIRLVGATILNFEEIIQEGDANDQSFDKEHSTCTYTFYKINTNKGYIDLRWYGASNGYYSERVTCEYYTSMEELRNERNLIKDKKMFKMLDGSVHYYSNK